MKGKGEKTWEKMTEVSGRAEAPSAFMSCLIYLSDCHLALVKISQRGVCRQVDTRTSPRDASVAAAAYCIPPLISPFLFIETDA